MLALNGMAGKSEGGDVERAVRAAGPVEGPGPVAAAEAVSEAVAAVIVPVLAFLPLCEVYDVVVVIPVALLSEPYRVQHRNSEL